MKVIPTKFPEVLILEPRIFCDDRGYFMESWNEREFRDAIGLEISFVQDNHSRSSRNVLRGIHYQLPKPQGKLVRAVSGVVFDVAIDLRRSSSTFGDWVGIELSADNKRQLWIPAGFGHGFLVVSDYADFLYKTSEYWFAECDRTIAWNDPSIGVAWPCSGEPILAKRDLAAPALAEAEVFP